MTATAVRPSAKPQDRPLGVVIADDHAIFRDGLRGLLEHAGLQVLGEARDGLEAVTLARQLTPDVLLLDLSMPKHSGLEALHELSAYSRENSIRIILLTAAAEKTEIVEALQLGARGIVMKASATDVPDSVFAGRAKGVPRRSAGEDLRAHRSGIADCSRCSGGNGEQGDCRTF
jgi:CheY-like chemotaxis protein